MLSDTLNIEIPIIGGAMYPCSNPELVAAVSESGGIGIIQPLSLIYVNGYDFKEGLDYIKSLTKKPIGMNVIVEKSSKKYDERMKTWVDIAIAEGVRFFVTSLGNPKWVVDKAHAVGGVVYHAVTEAKWAEKALKQGVDGLICVNERSGGHAGTFSKVDLYNSMKPFGKPLICAGGIGSEDEFKEALDIGYDGVQMGTRFIATTECSAHIDYKEAIVKAHEDDVVLTDKISGVPVAVLKTPYIEKTGTKAGPLAAFLLRGAKTKHWMRLFYTVRSFIKLKKAANKKQTSYKDYWQAGKSVEGIDKIESVADVMQRFKGVVKK